jgi:hypothetical protein
MVAAVAVLAVAGIGFAAFTSLATVQTTSTAGSMAVVIYNDTTQVNDNTLWCTGVNSGAWLNITAGPFAPGDSCTVFGNVTNTGNLPANVLANWPHTGSSCFVYTVTFPTHNPYVPPSGRGLAPGAFEKFQFTLTLNATAGNSCENQVGYFDMFFNATAL